VRILLNRSASAARPQRTGRLASIGVECMTMRLTTILAACSLVLLAPSTSWAQVKPKPATAPKPAAAPAQPAAPPATAAEATPAASATPTAADAAQNPPPPEWVSRCASEGRQGALECALEQTAFLSKTGQLVTAVTVRVPADTRQPTMAVQVPVGLYLPGGVNLQIDDGKAMPLVLQTCDLKGCYAGTQVSAEMLAALKAGKKLSVTFQSLNKENISVPLQLSNFAQAYQKIQ